MEFCGTTLEQRTSPLARRIVSCLEFMQPQLCENIELPIIEDKIIWPIASFFVYKSLEPNGIMAIMLHKQQEARFQICTAIVEIHVRFSASSARS